MKTFQAELVCTVYTRLKGSKTLGVILADPDDPENEDLQRVFARKGGLKRMSPGGVYLVTFADEERSRAVTHGEHDPKFVRQHPDREKVATWRVLSEALDVKVRAEKARASFKSDKSAVLDLLQPIRDAYTRTDATGRAAIEVVVLQYLRYGR